MKTNNSYAARAVKSGVAISAALLLSSCFKSTPVKPPPEPEKPAYFKEISPAAQFLAQSLSQKIESKTPAIKHQLVIDEFFNEKTAEVSAAGHNLQRLLIEAMNKSTPTWNVSLLSGKALHKAEWAVTGTVNILPPKKDSNEKWVNIKAVINDIQTGKVLAQTEAFVDATQFNAEPTRFYKDAPMYSPATRLTEKRPDMTNSISGSLQQKLKVEALLADARDAYEKEDFFAAENIFNEILQQNEKNNFSALSGLYQSQLRANHLKEAENTFGNLVDSGFDAGNLSVKFLFKVRSTEFLENNELATQYPIWVRQIAQKLKGRNQCLAINGHASRSGNEEYNKQLSLQRSIRIITLLNKISPSISTNLKAYGKGYSENIVGSGTNDALDAIDRRVEFSIIKCS